MNKPQPKHNISILNTIRGATDEQSLSVGIDLLSNAKFISGKTARRCARAIAARRKTF